MIYFDNCATTKPSSIGIRKILQSLNENWFNPSALYDLGADVEFDIDYCRKKISSILNCNKNNIIFTSSGTESNNLAIFGSLLRHNKKKGKIVTTAIEHKSVLEPFNVLKKNGFEVDFVFPDNFCDISCESFLEKIDNNVIFVSCMLVNNEVGSIMPVFEIAKKVKEISPNCIFHCDATQALLKMDIDLSNSNIDLMTFSGHKVFSPKGIGALYVKHIDKIDSIIYGASQEYGLRAGTENTSYILAFSENIDVYSKDIKKNQEHIDMLFQRLKNGIDKIDGVEFNIPKNHSTYINNIWVKNINSETVLHFLENYDIYVSSGSSCNKGKKSYVLGFFDDGDKRSTQSIRISFSKDNTLEEVDEFLRVLSLAVQKLVKVR